jgi:hypothetical protein
MEITAMRFVSGPDFSRAANAQKKEWASALRAVCRFEMTPGAKLPKTVKLFAYGTEVLSLIQNHFQAKLLKEFWRDFHLDLVF